MQTTTVRSVASTRVRYTIDTAHASAQFKVRHLMVSHVRGELGPLTGDAEIDERDLARSEIFALIDATKIDTRNVDRDAHLRSEDFLDVARYPTVGFRSLSMEKVGVDEYDVLGLLTIRETTRRVTLRARITDAVRDPWGNVKRGVSATTRIDRSDFGLRWNAVTEAGGVVVGDVVEITIELELVRAP